MSKTIASLLGVAILLLSVLIHYQDNVIRGQRKTIQNMMRNPACMVEPRSPIHSYHPLTEAPCELKIRGRSVPVMCPVISDN